MIIENKSAPTIAPLPTAKSNSRDAAIAAFNKSSSLQGQLPVPNANQISPEDLSAITQTNKNEVLEEHNVQQTSESVSQEATKTQSAEPLSKHYANLARKERSLTVQRQRLQADMEAFKASQSAKPAEIDQSKFISKDKLLQDPFAVLNELGLSYDQLTNSALNQPKPEELAFKKLENELKSELQKVRDAQEKAAKDAEQLNTQSYQQALNQIKMDTKQLVNSDPDAYEAIRSTGSISDVVELIEETFKKDGILLSVEDAAREVEEYLSEEAFKLSQLKKIQNRMKSAATKPATIPVQKQQQSGLKTLTNAVGSSKPLSVRERAIAAFKGELK